MHHASYPVLVHRPAGSDWTSSRPRLTTTPLPFSLPSALRKPGHGTCTHEVTCHAWHTRFEQIDKRFEQVDKRFEQMDKRFEQIDKRFEAMTARMDRFMIWSFATTLTVGGIVVAAIKYLP